MAIQEVAHPRDITLHKGVSFENSRILVDGQRFVDCQFKKCVLVYGGGLVPHFENCTLVDISWTFDDEAGNTITFLQTVYNSFGEGGRQLVDIVFKMIRDSQTVPGTPANSGEMVKSKNREEGDGFNEFDSFSRSRRMT